MSEAPTLEALLIRHRDALHGFVTREASGLLRFESADDLVQGVHLRALSVLSGFDYRGEKPFFAWLYAVAQRHIADRNDYWSAMKRGTADVLRYTASGASGDPLAVLLPADSITGPGTFASRRELLVLVARALSVLPDRDRALVRWMSESVALEEQARRLDSTYAVTQRAGLRAVERFRKTFRLLTNGGA